MKTLLEQLPKEIVFTYEYGKDDFSIPRLPEAQCIVIPVVREVIAPILIRNNDTESITDILAAGQRRVRMIASKTKGVERRRADQILRILGTGGKMAANKGYIRKERQVGDVFDLSTYVFGYSANANLGGGKDTICSVHSAVLYSDALSIQAISELTDNVFRQGGISEEFVTFDAEDKTTSPKIFKTHAVLPPALLVQTLVMTGNRMTCEALNHLLLSIGLSGAYGGATATTGTNLKTHLCGIYWGKLERPVNAPEEILKAIGQPTTPHEAVEKIEQLMRDPEQGYPFSAATEQLSSAAYLQNYVKELIHQFETDQPELKAAYQKAEAQMRELFNAWFTKPDKAKKK
ncbi:hypothetical protein [Thioflexithrix psekupsensis]|uniref:Type I-D CRISPR-associated protein Cas7/Csc2 n=1 Tax=Thioflexithrix psekupsensis TaxID=1570016 RepID=A0A251X620_9GAMM|nr:hypothetical protein [Thioflexithrix psekupsensis]OUD13072.1 hypothetical protein TPSD3_10500 [Thioflexithrix psekupsensis]